MFNISQNIYKTEIGCNITLVAYANLQQNGMLYLCWCNMLHRAILNASPS